MISVIDGSASNASRRPRPSTSSRTESTRRSLSFLVIVIAVERKYSSASSRIFSRTPGLLLESIWSAYFSIRRAWIWTLAAVKAGVSSPPTAAAALRCDSDGAGAGGAVDVADCEATGIDVGAPYVVAAAGMGPTAGAGGPPAGGGGG